MAYKYIYVSFLEFNLIKYYDAILLGITYHFINFPQLIK